MATRSKCSSSRRRSLVRLVGIEAEVVESAELMAYAPATKLPVARTGHLIALKVLSESKDRLQGRIDLKV